MHMQGKCWRLPLSNMSRDGQDYLEGYKRFNGWGGYPYGTLYSALGMSVHAVGPPENEDVLFGAPGTYGWTGTMAAMRFE